MGVTDITICLKKKKTKKYQKHYRETKKSQYNNE